MYGALRRSMTGVLAVLALAGGLLVAAPAQAETLDEPSLVEPTLVDSAETPDRAIVDTGSLEPVADAADFDRGYIISDAQFYDSDAMTEAQIQSFLTSRSATCQNTRCLDILRQNTIDLDLSRCSVYRGASNETVARIIYKVQQACGISAKVLLVTLQKEQGLVTSTAPTQRAVDYAMGYGCPDTAPCNEAYKGIAPQLLRAANQFRAYQANPGSYRHQVGVPMNLYYHPNSWIPDPPTCGTVRVTIRNQATAGLYNYTPYTPNTSALNNLYGTGDSCASYGNRNFWRLYTDWFGSPTGQMADGVTASRVSGENRYDTSAAISAAAYAEAPTGGTVFVATGASFADGLAAAPAAAQVDAPLLLTDTSTLSTSVRREIERLQPSLIIIMGGESAVSSRVARQLSDLAPQVRRDSGADRYATARAIARANFPEGATTAYFASGGNFPDALAASAAAGAEGAPVLLLPPGARSVDAATKALLVDLGVTRVILAGGTSVISTDVATSVRSGTAVTVVQRRGGADRYKTAAAINDASFPDAEFMYLASGVSFPDALAIAAVAGAQGRPLALSNTTCIPAATVGYATLAGVTQVQLVGGTSVLTSRVGRFTPCT